VSAPRRLDLVNVSGPDAERYLQGQLSQDVTGAPPWARWSFLLQPNGKVDAVVEVRRLADDEYVIAVDAGWGRAVVERLRRFLIRTKASVEPAGEEPDARFDDEAARIEGGWPAMGSEITTATIPGETGLVALAASFTKGCYTGQELVERIDSRGGNVARHLRLLRGPGVAAGAAVVHGGVDVGTVTSAVPGVGLAYLRRTVGPGDTVEVGGEPAVVEATAVGAAER
jgi:folate-binding protein YgfZ